MKNHLQYLLVWEARKQRYPVGEKRAQIFGWSPKFPGMSENDSSKLHSSICILHFVQTNSQKTFVWYEPAETRL